MNRAKYSVSLKLLGALALLLSSRAQAENEPPSRDTRIALRYGFGEVLIIGGKSSTSATGSPQLQYKIPLIPAYRVFVVTPEFIRTQDPAPQPKTEWGLGDKWKLYSGAGP